MARGPRTEAEAKQLDNFFYWNITRPKCVSERRKECFRYNYDRYIQLPALNFKLELNFTLEKKRN